LLVIERRTQRKSVEMSKGKTERVIVSGAMSGIGRAIAVRIAGRAILLRPGLRPSQF